MTKQTIIPAGYRITVTSWENDADNYNTEVKEGLSLEQCKLYVDLCKLMEGDDDVSNLYEPDEEELALLKAALVSVAKQHLPAAELDEDATEEDMNDVMMDIIYDLGLAGGDFCTRVCEEWKVEHVPVEIVLNDVTEEFM